ncbi:MAG: HlyC/CorC family transporter [Rhizobiaceae bacterium]|nr:HlyC/CorC family transporter [Rhizobiaceae bacterium]
MLDAFLQFITENWVILATIIFLICLSGFFSGSETALTAVSRARMHSFENNGEQRAGIVNKLIERRDRLIGALLIGNNLVNILASSLATSMLLSIFGESGVVFATLIMTAALVVFAEVLPKSWAISTPDKFAMFVAPIIRPFVLVVGPLSTLINAIVRAILGIFGVSLASDASMLSPQEEIRGAVDLLHREGSVVKADKDRLGGVLDLGDLEVSDVMVHRTSVQMLNADDTTAHNVKTILESPYTRVPVWRDEPNNIIGVIHAKDLLRALAAADNKVSNIDIMKIAQKPWFVPDATNLKDQLNAFLRRKAHVAIVIDEYGEFEGLVTLEDILEEIVGEIADEHDLDVQGVSQQADGSVIVDGSVPVRDLNRAFDWTLPDEDATTVAGLVIHESQIIPEEKQAFTFHGMRFIVLKRSKNRITKLSLRPASQTIV